MNKHLLIVKCIVLSILFSVTAFAQAPVANFTANTVSGCSPIVVQFTDLSTNTPTSWYWDLGNGSTSTIQHPSTTYITPGTYTITLTATNGSGNNTKTVTNYITVAALPTVAFTGDSTPSCTIPRTIIFTNNSVPNGSGVTSYLWDFGDGTTSTAAGPTKTYTTYGNFTVTLLVTNGNGCSNSLSKTGYIKNQLKPTASFTATNNNSCTAPATVSFTNTSSGAVSYAWDFGDGNTSTASSPSHTYSTTGSYTVRLIATNAGGCKDTLTSTNFVSIGAPNAVFSTSVGTTCTGNTVTMSNTSSPAGFTSAWDFGDGGSSTVNNPSHIYTTSGTYTIRLIVTRGGCSDTDTKTVLVNTTPTINFTASPTTGCAIPFSTTFSNTSTGATSYLWRFGDGNTSTSANPGNTYTSFGTYTVKLIATGTGGCMDSFTRANYINVATPTASIVVGSYSGCVPVNVTCTANVSTIIPVTNYSWNFGDGSSVVSCSSCGVQSHSYTTPGTYTITLTYTTGTGCTYSTTTSVVINSKPTANFTGTPTSICPGAPVTFSNTSSGATSYNWSFGDGGTSSSANPVYSGYSMGTFTVTLIANNNGCRDTFIRTNYITVSPPDAYFTIAASCTNRQTVTITDASVGANTYLWNFGDGNTSTQTGGTLTHTYAAPGTYNIVLQVTNTSNGCTSQYNVYVTLGPISANFSASDTTLCKNEGVLFTATGSSIISNYFWDLGAGITYNQSSYTLGEYYTTPGSYTVKLVVTDAYGCKDSLIKPNYIRVGGPTVDFTGVPVSGCLPLTVTFTDISIPNGGFAIANRVWTYGTGGTLSTSANPVSYTYTVAGAWPVKLVVTDANGCKDSLTKNNYISSSKPLAQFRTNDTNVCVGQNVQMINTSGGNNITYFWNFGDGNTSTASTPSHPYVTGGNYTVTLIVTDIGGCKDTMIRTAYVHVNTPGISFTMSDSVAPCPPLLVSFTNTSTSVVSYSWVFGNGSQSALNNPTTLYTYPGVYQVKLIGTNSAGCKDSAVRNVTVNGPTGTFSYAPLNGCTPLTVSFSATTNNTASLIWDMGNGFTQSTTSNSYSYTYTQTGRYVPKLILSDGASCLVPLQLTDTIKVDYLNADFNYSVNGLCAGSTVQFTDTVLQTLSPLSTRNWNFGDGNTSTAHNPTHIYTTSGTYNIRLIVANTQGCIDTIIKTLVIHGLPNVTAASNQNLCQGSATGVTISASGANTYVWTPATSLSCSTCTSPIALPSATTTYTVTGTDIYGCVDTGNVTITIVGVPNVTVSANTAICSGGSTALTASGATSYTWTPATGLSCTACANPTASPTVTTTYIVTGSNATGCIDTAMVTVTVNPLPVVSAGANAIICNGSSTVLTATGAASYVWTPSTGLSCTACASPTASPITTTIYTVTGTDGNTCTNTANVTVTVNPRPAVSAGGNVAICNGNSTTLTATGAATYVWTPTTGLSCSTCTSPIATPTTTTIYTVTGTDANGCTNTANVTVAVNAKPNVTASGSNVICNGLSTTLTANGASTYVWTPATGLSCTTCAGPVATPTTTTTYIVTGTDANGCIDTGVITVTVNAKPVISGGPAKIICFGAVTTLAASGASTYTWSPSTGLSCTACSNPNANPASTTTYTVIGVDVNGCRDTDQVLVTVNPLPLVTANPSSAICTGSSITLTAGGAVTYVWSPATGLSCTACASPIANPATTTTYTVTGTNANGCINTATTTITVNTIPVIVASGSKTICYGDTVNLNVSGASTYVWTPVVGLSCTTCPNPTAIPLNTITYSVTGTTNGCSDTDNVTITVRPQVPVSAGQDKEICIGDTTTLHASGAVTYIWSPAATLSCTNCTDPVATPVTTTTYYVKGTDADGCGATAAVKIGVHQLPAIDAGKDTTICNGLSVRLNASGGVNYIWAPGNTLSCTACQDPIATPIITTTYTVTGMDNIGCKANDEITVSLINKGPVTISPDVELCLGNSVTLTASGGTSYLWYPADNMNVPDEATVIAKPLVSTQYRVIIKQGDCFTDTAYVNAVVHELPIVELGPDKKTTAGTAVDLNAGTKGISKYSWSPVDYLSCTDCATPIATPRVTTKYMVQVANQWGCEAQDDITIFITCDKNQVFVPNTFTPNHDGVNDFFYPQGKGLSQVKSFRVYSRWGELIFSRQDMKINEPTIGWDGTYKNTPLKPDVFVYIINAVCESGEPIELKGDISLVR